MLSTHFMGVKTEGQRERERDWLRAPSQVPTHTSQTSTAAVPPHPGYQPWLPLGTTGNCSEDTVWAPLLRLKSRYPAEHFLAVSGGEGSVALESLQLPPRAQWTLSPEQVEPSSCGQPGWGNVGFCLESCCCNGWAGVSGLHSQAQG